MMKKLYTLLFIILFSMYATSVNASYFWVDGSKYRITDELKQFVELAAVPLLYEGTYVVPEIVKYDDIKYKVVSIGCSAFSCCENVEKIILPSSVQRIGEWAFAGCKRLAEITFSNNVNVIGYSAFRDCKSLKSIAIPSLVTALCDWTFTDCVQLTDVYIGANIASIGYSAFSGCESLNSIVCASLCPPEMSVAAFGKEISDNVVLTVPVGRKRVYEVTDRWNSFVNIIEK